MKKMTVFTLILVVLCSMSIFAQKTTKEKLVVCGDSLMVKETTTITSIKKYWAGIPKSILANPTLWDFARTILEKGEGEIIVEGKGKSVFNLFPLEETIKYQDTLFTYSSLNWSNPKLISKIKVSPTIFTNNESAFGGLTFLTPTFIILLCFFVNQFFFKTKHSFYIRFFISFIIVTSVSVLFKNPNISLILLCLSGIFIFKFYKTPVEFISLMIGLLLGFLLFGGFNMAICSNKIDTTNIIYYLIYFISICVLSSGMANLLSKKINNPKKQKTSTKKSKKN
jgi:hypothetical protein